MEKLHALYTEKTGVALYPGTLNIELAEPYDLPLEGVTRLEKEEYGGRVSVSILPCRVSGIHEFIVRTDQNAGGSGDHPRTIIEVAAQVRLREDWAYQTVIL
jgi:riboflavin kinase